MTRLPKRRTKQHLMIEREDEMVLIWLAGVVTTVAMYPLYYGHWVAMPLLALGMLSTIHLLRPLSFVSDKRPVPKKKPQRAGKKVPKKIIRKKTQGGKQK